MTDDEVTLGEVNRKLDALSRHVDARFNKLETDIARQSFVLKVVYDRDTAEANRRIGQLEDDKRFVFRALFTVVAAFIVESVFIVVSLRGDI